MVAFPDESDEVQRLICEHVPEVASGVVEIRSVARERGSSIMLAVSSNNPAIDPVGCCVGPNGALIKAVAQGLSGERISVIRWSESVKEMIRHVLSPLVIKHVELDAEARHAVVTVISNRTIYQTVSDTRLRLATKIIGWSIQLVEQ
jgi:N utilization substance protein A